MDIRVYCPEDFPSHLPSLQKLYNDLFSLGKGLRPKLVQRVGQHLNLPEREVLLISQTVEFIHNGSLLHDDLLDRSYMRRNKPAAWYKYSPEYAVLAGDYLLTRTVINISNYGNDRFTQCALQAIGNLVEGEWLQDSLHNCWDVSVASWEQVHRLKTSSLFKLCLLGPFLCLERYHQDLSSTLAELGDILGLLFQRSDDLLDFGVRNDENKIILGDLKAGYLNSFGAHLLQNTALTERAQFKNYSDLNQLKRAIGEKNFERSVETFDQINEQLIATYQRHLKDLESHLQPHEFGLIADLAQLPKILYWRKNLTS